MKTTRILTAIPLALALLVTPCATPCTPIAAAAEAAPDVDTGWYWLSSNAKYSNFFDPSSVKATGLIETAHGKVATEIEAYIKTGYSYGGAQETITAYGIKDVIPNPAQLAYSVALVKVNPQNRTFQYIKEDLYNAQNQVLWARAEGDGKEKEINSESFDEKFYTNIVDCVFGQGETARAEAEDRWLDLYTSEIDGLTTTAIADTSTMRMKGDNLFFWEWDTVKDAAGNTLEIKFLKKAVNLPNGTEAIVSAEYWSGQTGWQTLEDDLDGAYRYIKAGTPQAQGVRVLRNYAHTHEKWVNRYSIN
ncbi:hypothetical protein [uncultured Selenomonas sp.]|uniref:hypothetical protein n=1 Tax=uncultured Selenomonas sp. TaxID=159275 RepID=UPI0025D763CE|nr:hypothetical protein [uncultured Selenomonas sp.]